MSIVYFPERQPVSRSVELMTFNDAVESVLDEFGLDGASAAQHERLVRRAVLEAYRDLPSKRNWSYFYQRHIFASANQQIAGTIAYTQATRTVILSGATWPADAELYTLQINRVQYEIDRRVDDTTLILNPLANPGADLPAGTLYTLFRESYPLPPGFTALGKVIDITTTISPLDYATPDEYLQRNRGIVTTGYPRYYTIMRVPKLHGILGVFLGPPPNQQRTYGMVIQMGPQPIALMKRDLGDVSTTVDSASIVGEAGSFEPGDVGRVIRFSTSQSAPTTLAGSLDGTYNPFAFQRMIREAPDDTNAILDEPAPASLANVAAVVSDPIDLQEGDMYTYFLRLAEHKMCRVERWKDMSGTKRKEALDALREAAASDNNRFDMDVLFTSSRLRDAAQLIDGSF